jgi:CheY-like chemotaxis protein
MNMLRILVTDDDKIFREVITTKLSVSGFEVHEAENAEDAIKKSKALKPDLILMDISMPGKMNGVEAAMAIKSDAETSGIPIAFLSGAEEPWPAFTGAKPDVSRAIGMDDFLPKTIDLDELVVKVKALIAKGIKVPPPQPPQA